MTKRTLTLASVFGVLLIGLFAYLLFFDNVFSENSNELGDDSQTKIVDRTNVEQGKNTAILESDNDKDEDLAINEDNSDIVQDENEPMEEEPIEERDEEEPDQYKYIYEVESVKYEPDSANYGGFKICDLENSTCTVYGVEYKHIAKAVLGGKYRLSFNQLGVCKPALGTAYCLVEGDLGEVQIEQIEPY